MHNSQPLGSLMVDPGQDHRRKTLSADKVFRQIRDAALREAVILRKAWSRPALRNVVGWQGILH